MWKISSAIRTDVSVSEIGARADPTRREVVYNETADVITGDAITTSGLSQVYPEGIVIGKLTKVWANKDLGIRQGLVQPAADLAKIREAVVLVK